MRTTFASEIRQAFARPFMRWTVRALVTSGVALIVLLHTSSPRGEDIDIYARLPGANDLPNVLLVWDASANWGANISVPNCSYSDGTGGPKASAPGKEQGTKFGIEKC